MLACTCRTHVSIPSLKVAIDAVKTQSRNFSYLINMTITFTWMLEALM